MMLGLRGRARERNRAAGPSEKPYRMSRTDEDYPLVRVPHGARYPWFNVAVQRFGQLSDLTQFLLGATLGAGLSFWGAFWAFTLGSVILEVICIFVGIAGMREGLSTSLLARWTGFGRYGSSLIGLVVAVSLFGWFGIQTAVFAAGLHSMIKYLPLWLWCIITGLGVTVLVLKGFKAMGWTAFVTVPAFLGLAGWAMSVQISKHSVGSLIASRPFGPHMSIATGATIVAGSYIVGAVTTPDMTRFNRNTGDVVKQTLVGISLGEYVLGLAGVLLAYAVKSSDVVAIITASSGVAGVIILISATVKINNWNLYSASLGLINVVQSLTGVRLHRVAITVGIGVLGSILASAGILSRLTDFLTLLGVLTPPVAGIMVAEYFVVRRWRSVLDASRRLGRLPETEPTWVPATIVLWAGAALIGWFSEYHHWPGTPALNSLLIAGVGYAIAAGLGLARGARDVPVQQPEPVQSVAASHPAWPYRPPSAVEIPRRASGRSHHLRIGIDVGGTNTDAVLLDGDTVLATVKRPTSADVLSGVVAAVDALLVGSGAAPGSVTAVMIGTTQFVNALVEADGLVPTAAIRLGLPATAALPPMVDWPKRLRDAIGGHVYLCRGGNEYDGREIAPLDEDELRKVAADIAAIGLRSVAITSVFSPVSAEFELRAADLIAAELGGVHVSLSHEIGRIGLLPRENATIVNAALRDLAVTIVDAFGRALGRAGITAPLLLSQNDGTLMDVEYARRYPVATFASGPTNSMRGAAYLSGLADCAVVDVGGTTTDVGMLSGGFPRQSSTEAQLAGVRTNVRIPDVLSLGVGGGSLVSDGPVVGPRSVGYRLTEEALVFGGSTLTATDLAVAGGYAEIGDPSLVVHLDPELVRAGLASIARRIAETVDRMRTSAGPLPVVAVGGGSVLIPEDLPGFDDVRRPENFAVANAIGAAIAQVGGEVDRVFQVPEGRRVAVLKQARAEAAERAQQAGARPGTISIVDVEEVPLAYLPGGATRIRVKAVGDLDVRRLEDGHA
jgi:N-methylhydantoinase A/oxoprolinase/acetone carboxylase beta subunit/purine-cytosine permease-like protein